MIAARIMGRALGLGAMIFAVIALPAPGYAADIIDPVPGEASVNQVTVPYQERSGDWAVTIYGGLLSSNAFSRLMFMPWSAEVTDIPWLAASVSRRIGSLGDLLTLELEGGAGHRFGSEDATEVWGALFFRYDDFPWNHIVHTTIAASTGVNLASRITQMEVDKDGDENSKLLHYLGPEITFARPEDLDTQLLIRLHHRSGVFGLFDGATGGSNIVTLGLRKRF